LNPSHKFRYVVLFTTGSSDPRTSFLSNYFGHFLQLLLVDLAHFLLLIIYRCFNVYLQINGFLVMTIIGCVFAALQFVLGAAGAGSMDFEAYYDSLHCDDNDRRSYKTYNEIGCREVMLCFFL